MERKNVKNCFKGRDYELFKQKFIDESNKLGRPLKFRELVNNSYGLPSSRWFITNCPNNGVKNYNQFIEWCGFKPNENISKGMAIQIILDMQSRITRPLMQDDFNNPKANEIGIRVIYRIWGSFNAMKAELGLEIIMEDMVNKSRNFKTLQMDIMKLCKNIYEKENRKIITLTDIDKNEDTLSSQTYTSIFKQNNTTLREFLKSIGFSMVRAGRGLNYMFEDGEKVKSSYEYEFSRYLRETLGLEFNKDYVRDIKYKTFVKDEYKRRLDCDYIINYQGRTIYIEVTGLLRDYDKYYYEDRIINSKSKEKYRIKLMEKEKMLKENNLEYYLLFPIFKNYQSVLDFDKINEIFNNISKISP